MLRILGNASSINVRKVLGACAEIPAMDINTRCLGFIAAVDDSVVAADCRALPTHSAGLFGYRFVRAGI